MTENDIRGFVQAAAEALPGSNAGNPNHTKLFNSCVAELTAQFLVDVHSIAVSLERIALVYPIGK